MWSTLKSLVINSSVIMYLLIWKDIDICSTSPEFSIILSNHHGTSNKLTFRDILQNTWPVQMFQSRKEKTNKTWARTDWWLLRKQLRWEHGMLNWMKNREKISRDNSPFTNKICELVNNIPVIVCSFCKMLWLLNLLTLMEAGWEVQRIFLCCLWNPYVNL